ncbi:hypothetical protein B0H14DRAFT_3675154 [Mycena olivaceomarginata]|nr:hypothetical protein B0H14DRAFT_3675154 [Mycena olivaceomarginata]
MSRCLQPPRKQPPSYTTTTTNSDSSDSGFSLSSSPPLIIAFLAVGVFAISMVTFFGWRRMTAGRVWIVPAPTVSIGETPKLWDIWSPRERPHRATEWHNIQPLAATVWDEYPPPAPANNGPPRHHSLVAAALAHLRWRYRRRGSQDGTALEEKLNHDPLVRLQVAVTIAMPCPDYVEILHGQNLTMMNNCWSILSCMPPVFFHICAKDGETQGRRHCELPITN